MVVPKSPPMSVTAVDAPQNSSEDFERWIRMATDNKINTQNSWDLALIDYFHDLSLLRDGDGINFQKASATLDGCVKIYSSRVDSAVTETGRLINGLATSKKGQSAEEDEEEDEEEDNELDPHAPVKQRKQKVTIQKETLVEFEVIKVKKMDLELAVDPLFKRALAEFDEGGSKSLLLNMLNLDSQQKIMLDTTDSAQPVKEMEDESEPEKDMCEFEQSFADMDIDQPEELESSQQINITELGEQFFGGCDFAILSVCASLKELKAVLYQNGVTSNALREIENVNLNNYYKDQQQEEISRADMSFGAGDFDLGPDEPLPDQNNSKFPGNRSSIFFNDLEDEADDYGITIRSLFNESKQFTSLHNINEDDEQQELPILNIPDENLLAYFDEHQRKTWAGPDHWKVQNIKKAYNLKQNNGKIPSEQNDDPSQQNPKTKKTKDRLVIDFLSEELPDEDVIFEQGSTITLPKKEWISVSKNVLPVDKHFSTRNFIHLFSKEQLIKSTFSRVKNMDDIIDETLYAQLNQDDEALNGIPNLNNPDFFHDNDHNDYASLGGGDIDFGDDHGSIPESQQFSSQLATKASQQSPLSYSRVAKKVDIKLLKDNIWDTLNQERNTRKSIVNSVSSLPSETENSPGQENTLKFSEIVSGLTNKYDSETKKDLSTSFCFICLLHLANENGFTIQNNKDNSDLIINDLRD